ncbi:MAG: hypothetical protein Q7S21_03150 [archaeon]|nr:hypothetical protein [archaeon]
MKKFIVIYHAPATWSGMKNASPEDMKKGMEQWMKWAQKCGTGLVDMGTPLNGGQKLSKSSNTPSKRGVMGYSILQADSMKKAIEMLKGHPHLEWANQCEIEVHECMPTPGQ